MKEMPRVKDMMQKVSEYNANLKELRLKDYQIKNLETGKSTSVPLLVLRIIYFCFLFVLALPGSVVLAPIVAIAKPFAQKKAKVALAKSSVKIHGTDVIASFKGFSILVHHIPLITNLKKKNKQ